MQQAAHGDHSSVLVRFRRCASTAVEVVTAITCTRTHAAHRGRGTHAGRSLGGTLSSHSGVQAHIARTQITLNLCPAELVLASTSSWNSHTAAGLTRTTPVDMTLTRTGVCALSSAGSHLCTRRARRRVA